VSRQIGEFLDIRQQSIWGDCLASNQFNGGFLDARWRATVSDRPEAALDVSK